MSQIQEGSASGQEIAELVSKLEPHLEGESTALVIITLLSMVLVTMKEDITPDELQTYVSDVSRYICSIFAEEKTDTPMVVLSGNGTLN